MPKSAKFSLATIDGGGLSQPVSTLITKVAQVVGDLFLPGQVKRIAQIQTAGAGGLTKGKSKITELQRRALVRFVQEQGIQQTNMEAIMGKAIAEVKETADAEALDEDWIAHFFGKCRTVSNDAMRELWAKVLAAEVNQPGTFSRRTLNLLGDLDRKDVESFTLLCSFSIYSIAAPVILYKSGQMAVSYNPSLYVKYGLDLSLLGHLEALGLIQFDLKSEYTKPAGPIRYFGKSLTVNPANPLKVGNAAFTKPGWELARAMTPREIPEFFDHLKRAWQTILVEGPSAPPRNH